MESDKSVDIKSRSDCHGSKEQISEQTDKIWGRGYVTVRLVNDDHLISQINSECFSGRLLQEKIVRQEDQLDPCMPYRYRLVNSQKAKDDPVRT